MNTNNTPIIIESISSAVILVVKQFTDDNKPFSIHDITKEIRNKCNFGLWRIPCTYDPDEDFNNIQHTEVKHQFQNLLDLNIFSFMGLNLTVQFNGHYRIFEHWPLPKIVQGTFLQQSDSEIKQPITVTLIDDELEIVRRIKTYLNNNHYYGRPTLKMIQSAIKRGNRSTGVSTSMIKCLIDKYELL